MFQANVGDGRLLAEKQLLELDLVLQSTESVVGQVAAMEIENHRLAVRVDPSPQCCGSQCRSQVHRCRQSRQQGVSLLGTRFLQRHSGGLAPQHTSRIARRRFHFPGHHDPARRLVRIRITAADQYDSNPTTKPQENPAKHACRPPPPTCSPLDKPNTTRFATSFPDELKIPQLQLSSKPGNQPTSNLALNTRLRTNPQYHGLGPHASFD